jgi:hypothetical protein
MPASRLEQDRVAKRRAEVLTARAAGMTWDQIARTVEGVPDGRAAAKDYREAMKRAKTLRALSGEAGDALELELQRLDAAQLAVEGVLRKAAAEPAESGRAQDRVLRAADRLIAIAEKREAILGLADGSKAPRPAGQGDELSERRARVSRRRRALTG